MPVPPAPLDRPHLWKALRCTELNPVRAGLVSEAESWSCSSATIHCGAAAGDGFLTMEPWSEQWSALSWKEYLSAGEPESEILSVRQCTHARRPLGSEEFVRSLEADTKRPLAPRKGGRPPNPVEDVGQEAFSFEP